MFKQRAFITLSFLFLMLQVALAQVNITDANNGQKELMLSLEEYYGSNDLLLNGRAYMPNNPKIGNHPFFLNNEYYIGKIFIKGQCFSDVLLKYDLITDELVLHKEVGQNSLVELSLTYELVDSFYISTHLFVNKRKLDNQEKVNGYLKQLYKGKISFFRQYKKVFQADYTSKTPYGSYLEEASTLFVYDKNGFHKLRNKQAFLAFFGSHKKELKKYIRQHNFNFKEATSEQLYSLLQYADQISGK